jgi:long-subunit acyl-CoA synthetase (AMP-forming)
VESLDRTQWKSWTYKQYLADVRKLARAMMAVGVEQFSYGAPRAAAGPLRICCPEQAPPASRTGRGSAVGASSPAHARALVYSDGCNGSSVGIWGFNSPEWFLADMATVFCGAKAAGIYPTDTPDQVPTTALYDRSTVVTGAGFMDGRRTSTLRDSRVNAVLLQVQYKLRHSDSRVVVVEDQKMIDVLAKKAQPAQMQHCVCSCACA